MARRNEAADEQVQSEMTIGEGEGTSKTKETIRVEFLTNCTHNRDRYQAGQRADVPEDVFDALSKAKAVRRLGE